jgi:hypothetical protein
MGFEEVIEENKRALEERNRFKRMHLASTTTSQVQKQAINCQLTVFKM